MSISESKIVKRLIDVGKTIGEKELLFTDDPLVGPLAKDDPFAFLLAASVDRGMAAEKAWRLPLKIKSTLGHLDPTKIAVMTSDEMLAVLRRIDGKPRYLTDAAKTLVDVADHVVNRYEGDARNLWKNQRAQTIKQRMQALYGVGPGIASMVVILLDEAKEILLDASDYAGMDPKPDVNVQRVFARLGLCGRNPSEGEVIRTARRVHPEYPGILDGPAWHIGRSWCHSESPSCSDCPMADVCSKVFW